MRNANTPEPTISPKKAGRQQQKLRTRRLLLETVSRLLAAGERPTVTEAADAAGVSRRTAYRYFPTATKLHADAALDTLRPVMEAAMDAAPRGNSVEDVEDRISALAQHMQRLAQQNEALLRTMIHETVLVRPAAKVERPRGGRRLEWIESAVEPVRERLPVAEYKQLVSALALCTGIESLLVLRDICGLSAKEAAKVSQWMCRTLVRESLALRDTGKER